jgi:hypothetical protein
MSGRFFSQDLAIPTPVNSYRAKKDQTLHACLGSSLNYSGRTADIDALVMKMGCGPVSIDPKLTEKFSQRGMAF